MKLPFQDTLKRKFHRFLAGANFEYNLQARKLVSALLQNAGISLKKVDEVLAILDEESSRFVSEDDFQIVHGKDLISTLACVFRSTPEDITPILFLSIDYEIVRAHPNVASVEAWIRPAAAP
jgi:hypothetical protein